MKLLTKTNECYKMCLYHATNQFLENLHRLFKHVNEEISEDFTKFPEKFKFY